LLRPRDEHTHHVLQRGLADRHGAGERMEDADFNRLLGLGGKRRREAKCQSRRGGKQAAGERSLGGRTGGGVRSDVLLLTPRKRSKTVATAESQAACQARTAP